MPPTRRNGRGGGSGAPGSRKLRSKGTAAAAEAEEEKVNRMEVDDDIDEDDDGSDSGEMMAGGGGEEPDDDEGQDSDASDDTTATEEVVLQGSGGGGGQGDATTTSAEGAAATSRSGGAAGPSSSGGPQPMQGAAAAAATKKKGKSKKKVKKSAYPYEGLGDLGVVVDGIQDLVKGVGQCAKASLMGVGAGGGEDADGTLKKANEAILAQYRDIGMVLARTHEKLHTIPDAVRHVYEDLEIEELAAGDDGIGGDQQFLSVLGEFEKAAKDEAAKRCESITVEQVEGNPVLKRFIGELDRNVAAAEEQNRNAAKKKAAEQQLPRGGTSSRTSASRGRLPTTPRRAGGSSSSTQQQQHSEDLSLLTEYIPTTDPITRKRLRDPVVNKCGHVYERRSMEDMIMCSKGMRCPIPGCSNRDRILIEDLKSDPEMSRKIAAKIREERDNE